MDNWLQQCATLRAQLGPWNEFAAKSATTCGMKDRVCLQGPAVFQKDSFDVLIGWKTQSTLSPQLMFIDMGRAGKVWSRIPPWHQEIRDTGPTLDETG